LDLFGEEGEGEVLVWFFQPLFGDQTLKVLTSHKQHGL